MSEPVVVSPVVSPRSSELRTNYERIAEQVHRATQNAGRSPEEVRIIAVSKTQSIEVVQAALDAGLRVFGENYAQEIKDKGAFFANNPVQAEWHCIGHLQTNKVKMIAPYVHYVQSLDSPRLAQELNKAAAHVGRTIDVLLQVKTSDEETKSGCEAVELPALVEAVLDCPHLRIQGLMTIAAFSDDIEYVRPMFRHLRSLRDTMQRDFPDTSFHELSMGMSGDFTAAIEEGATMIRVGTAIFGARNYKNG
ncbi:MAG: YggS family pyridoxal phosphate-dependent enzyme [Candidatus Kapaibacterium sp.]|nr:MAG: YggS family pyridoxal phosphate-dependent enzyme [Candidatus Kapabacteria bacterium]